jgi:exo-1,4-beta-D-glucosaminidase
MSIYPEEYEREATAFKQQVLRARHHPSVFLWTYGSDRLPHPDLEVILNNHMAQVDPTRPIVTTCRGVEVGGHANTSSISGPSAVKMLGPYDWVSPNYWYIDTLFGGAYGFNTETGPGPQIPPIESIQRMLPQKHLWPMDSMWNYHLGRNEFGTLNRYLRAFNARYGEAKSLEDFAFRNQISNYEAIRGMFEAFAVNKYKSTGVIQWMLNSAWPEMYWQLYDYYLMPNGAFYGTKKASAPLMAIYNYGDKNIYVNNDHLYDYQNLNLSVSVFDTQSKKVYSHQQKFNIDANSSALIHDMPALKDLSTTYFLDVRISDENDHEVANNFYWLSTQEDVPDFTSTTWIHTPNKAFAELTGINTLKPTTIAVDFEKSIEGEWIVFTCKLSNSTDLLAFFIELRVVDANTSQSVLPVFWDDNYVSLVPGTQKVLKGKVKHNGLKLDDFKLVVKGHNVML